MIEDKPVEIIDGSVIAGRLHAQPHKTPEGQQMLITRRAPI